MSDLKDLSVYTNGDDTVIAESIDDDVKPANVPCYECAAPPFDACISRSGRAPGSEYHARRELAARAINWYRRQRVPEAVAPCPECNGDTVRFRGQGVNRERWLCSRIGTPGHLTAAEVSERTSEATQHTNWNGRMA